MSDRIVYQFKITLKGVRPIVWRRIQVPRSYSFWDLHIAIQDAMGWLDYHLHMFCLEGPNPSTPYQIGIPDDEGLDEIDLLPGWEVGIDDFFIEPGNSCTYEYDFGDDWNHDVLLEGILLKEKRRRYPVCLDGERACPPEDCGGPGGFEDLLRILTDPTDEEYTQTREWVGRGFDPDKFAPKKVKFDDPLERWKIAFQN